MQAAVKSKWVLTTIVFVGVCVMTIDAGAATIPVAGDTADTMIRYTISTDTTDVRWNGMTMEATRESSSLLDVVILVFELPDLAGETIQSADLSIYLDGYANQWFTPGPADLYGVRSAAASTVLTTDHYTGDNDPSATMIADSFLVSTSTEPDPATPNPAGTDAAADAALGAWLQSLYDAGASAGDFAFLRINMDASNLGDDQGYRIKMANDATYAPVLTIETVPEPATMTLLGLGGLAAIARRRR